MIYKTEASLRVWHPAGNPISGQDFIESLSIDASKFVITGLGRRWETARIVGFELSLETYKDLEEPHEAYAKALQESFLILSEWLSTLSLDAFETLRINGFLFDIFITIMIDQNQFEFDLPAKLFIELGRLNIPARIMSND